MLDWYNFEDIKAKYSAGDIKAELQQGQYNTENCQYEESLFLRDNTEHNNWIRVFGEDIDLYINACNLEV